MVREIRLVLTIATLLPDLLGTYGDGGNGLVLAERARRRGNDVRLVTMELGDELPEAEIYLLGGGEDGPQRLARDLLIEGSFHARVEGGATVLAVCAGLQILGESFSVEGDDEFEGLGIVDVRTKRARTRSVGELLVDVGGRALVGFENHGGETSLGDGVTPLGRVRRGRGNDGNFDGFRSGSIWATYAHGPVLALNPWLADELLQSVLGHALEPLVSVADDLYNERVAALNSR
ncbi:MAG: glutamine amidotransferase [Acidobacteria bacterium]|nr:glutamine amidotransferase [Acidobacteriota bacterium]